MILGHERPPTVTLVGSDEPHRETGCPIWHQCSLVHRGVCMHKVTIADPLEKVHPKFQRYALFD